MEKAEKGKGLCSDIDTLTPDEEIVHGLAETMRSLAHGKFERLLAPSDSVWELALEEKKEPEAIMLLMALNYARMLGQLAHQIGSSAFPDVLNCHVRLEDVREDMGDFGRRRDYKSLRERLFREICNLLRIARLLSVQISYRTLTDPEVRYPEMGSVVRDWYYPKTADCVELLRKLCALFEKWMPQLEEDVLNVEITQAFDVEELRKALDIDPRDTGEPLEPLADEFYQKMGSMVKNMESCARRHNWASWETCKNLSNRLIDIGFITPGKSVELADLFQDALKALQRDSAAASPSVVVVNGNSGGKSRGRPTSIERQKQVEEGVRRKRKDPNKSLLAIASEIIDTWKTVKGDKAAEGYQKSASLSGQIARALKRSPEPPAQV